MMLPLAHHWCMFHNCSCRISYMTLAAGSSIMACVCMSAHVQNRLHAWLKVRKCATQNVCALVDGDDQHLPPKQCPLCVSGGVRVSSNLRVCVQENSSRLIGFRPANAW